MFGSASKKTRENNTVLIVMKAKDALLFGMDIFANYVI